MRGRPTSLLGAAVLALFLCLGGLSSSAIAAARGAVPNATDHNTVLVLSGIIGPGALQRFKAEVARQKPDLIAIDGPGGRVFEAVLIATEIRRQGLRTLVRSNRSCASACAIVFLSGRTRYLGNGASVGLHAASNDGGSIDASGTLFMSRFLSGVGVPSRILNRMAETAPRDIHWLTAAEQRALRIQAYQ